AAGVHPARVAGHWQDGEDARQAAPWLVRAGDAAVGTLRFADAHGFYTRAEAVFVEAGDAGGAAGVRRTLNALAKRAEEAAS
ncbi:hypothetical protein ACFFLM_12730, partial [Deinococcus oregonensis]